MDLEKRKTRIRASRSKRQRAELSNIIHNRPTKTARLAVAMLIIFAIALCALATQAINVVV